MKKVCHLTSVHPRIDTRIFVKECVTLANAGFDVALIVADGKGNEKFNDIDIYDVGTIASRLKRFFHISKKIYKKALELDADIYHFHDPELIFIGSKLQKKGKKVFYDVHEDLPRQVLAKPYLPKIAKPALSKIIEYTENKLAKKLSGICTATPFIRTRFLGINKNSVDINNFPIIEELNSDINWNQKGNYICYIGGITEVRGIKEIIKTLNYLDNVTLLLAGNFDSEELRKEVIETKGWEKVKELGFLDRKGIKNVLEKSKVGLVTLHPIINYIDALPVKMFEYMIAGVPVVASNFELWKSIVETEKCGICVDPLNPKEIAQAIQDIISKPNEAKQMGENGKQAVRQKYNWKKEGEKLIEMYNSVL